MTQGIEMKPLTGPINKYPLSAVAVKRENKTLYVGWYYQVALSGKLYSLVCDDLDLIGTSLKTIRRSDEKVADNYKPDLERSDMKIIENNGITFRPLNNTEYQDLELAYSNGSISMETVKMKFPRFEFP